MSGVTFHWMGSSETFILLVILLYVAHKKKSVASGYDDVIMPTNTQHTLLLARS